MLAFSASTLSTVPVVTSDLYSVQTKGRCKGPTLQGGCGLLHFDPGKGHDKLAVSGPVGLAMQLQPIDRRADFIYSNKRQSASITCAAAVAMNARCSASGQTQTLTREAPTITKAPVREPTKTPQLDDGGPGLPPRDDDGGGGGGGGGGGNWSGGFFLFGFLAFLGFLKDQESDEDYRDSRRR